LPLNGFSGHGRWKRTDDEHVTDIKFVKADSDYFVPGADFKTK
jgi:hypothetical protein